MTVHRYWDCEEIKHGDSYSHKKDEVTCATCITEFADKGDKDSIARRAITAGVKKRHDDEVAAQKRLAEFDSILEHAVRVRDERIVALEPATYDQLVRDLYTMGYDYQIWQGRRDNAYPDLPYVVTKVYSGIAVEIHRLKEENEQ